LTAEEKEAYKTPNKEARRVGRPKISLKKANFI
jgi:hypothetical protein